MGNYAIKLTGKSNKSCMKKHTILIGKTSRLWEKFAWYVLQGKSLYHLQAGPSRFDCLFNRQLFILWGFHFVEVFTVVGITFWILLFPVFLFLLSIFSDWPWIYHWALWLKYFGPSCEFHFLDFCNNSVYDHIMPCLWVIDRSALKRYISGLYLPLGVNHWLISWHCWFVFCKFFQIHVVEYGFRKWY